MKNIRLFLQFVLFLVIVVGAVWAAPHIGQVLEGQTYESGQLSAPEIDRGHGEAHGDGHGDVQGEEHGAATDVHGQAEEIPVGETHDEGGMMTEAEGHAEETMAAEATETVGEAPEATVEEAAQDAMAEAPAEAADEAQAIAEDHSGAAETLVEEAGETGQAVPMEQVVEQVEEVTEPAPAAPAYPGDLVIQSLDPATATQAPVAFSHAKHEATAVLAGQCAFCHHKGGTVSCSSPGCHTDMTTKKMTGATENVSFEAAFHIKGDKSCVGCHRTLKSGPTSCKDCHPK